MTQLGGSFRFVKLQVVAELLADLGCTGRLNIVEGNWSGDVVLVAGQIVDAHLGDEFGRAAFESIALGLRQADFSFSEEPVDAEQPPLVAESERETFLMALSEESAALASVIPTLSSIPRFGDVDSQVQVTIKRSTLSILPLIAAGQTLERIATGRGLARTLRDIASLVDGGLIWLEEPRPLPERWAAELKRTPVAMPHPR